MYESSKIGSNRGPLVYIGTHRKRSEICDKWLTGKCIYYLIERVPCGSFSILLLYSSMTPIKSLLSQFLDCVRGTCFVACATMNTVLLCNPKRGSHFDTARRTYRTTFSTLIAAVQYLIAYRGHFPAAKSKALMKWRLPAQVKKFSLSFIKLKYRKHFP